MADMLIDDVKFAACLDAEADAIRAKTGDSNDIPFDYANNKGFADAIAAISGGGEGIDGWEYQKITFTPTEEIGRYGSGGGYPATEQYIKNLLPSGWAFARASYQSGQVSAYGINDLRWSSWGGEVSVYSRFNSNGVPEQMTGGKTGSQYSAILYPNCVYQVDVFKVVTANG